MVEVALRPIKLVLCFVAVALAAQAGEFVVLSNGFRIHADSHSARWTRDPAPDQPGRDRDSGQHGRRSLSRKIIRSASRDRSSPAATAIATATTRT